MEAQAPAQVATGLPIARPVYIRRRDYSGEYDWEIVQDYLWEKGAQVLYWEEVDYIPPVEKQANILLYGGKIFYFGYENTPGGDIILYVYEPKWSVEEILYVLSNIDYLPYKEYKFAVQALYNTIAEQ